MKLKKMICGLAAMVTMFSACVVPASAIRFETSETPGCPSFLEEYDTVINGRYSDYYLVYKNEWEGTYYECSDKYSLVFVTVDETTDMQKLYDLLGDEYSKDLNYYLSNELDENQHAFTYIEDFDYESLYAVDGVENVTLASTVFTETFCHEVVFDNDTDTEPKLIQICVSTEPDTVLTKEMFADTGYNVVSIEESDDYLKESGIDWLVYYETTGEIASPVDFTEKANQIEGIVSASALINYAASSTAIYDLTEIADLIGDANGDGIVNIADLILMKKYILETVSADMLDFSKSDLDNDGDLSAFDYISIKKKMLR